LVKATQQQKTKLLNGQHEVALTNTSA